MNSDDANRKLSELMLEYENTAMNHDTYRQYRNDIINQFAPALSPSDVRQSTIKLQHSPNRFSWAFVSFGLILFAVLLIFTFYKDDKAQLPTGFVDSTTPDVEIKQATLP